MARIAVALLLSVLTAAVPGGAATAAFPGKNGFVLFNTVWPSALQWGETSSAATTSVVCGVDQAGHTARFTATDRGLLASPGAWSRDGKMLAYVKQVGTDRYSVVVTTLAGRVVRTIDDASSPSFAPDGSRLAFERPSKIEIAIASLADGAIRTLAKDASSPAWAPDGSSIAFSSREAGRADISVIEADGSARRQVTTTGDARYPSWSPDGSKLVFSRDVRDGSEIAIVNRDGSGPRDVAHADRRLSSATWSPDGKAVAFVDERVTAIDPDRLGSKRVLYRGDFVGIVGDWQPVETATSSQSLPPCILWGTKRGERFVGSRWDDVIIGLDGNDVLRGGAGADQIDGGAGADTMLGGGGGDYIDGGDGPDVIDGGPGRDVVIGGYGNDSINTRDGVRDVVNCGRGQDRVVADADDLVKRNCERILRG